MRKTIILSLFLIINLNLIAQEINREGYFNISKLGILVRMNETPATTGLSSNGNGTEISTLNGWNFNSHLAAGIGVGISTYVNPTITTIPVYADIRYYLKETRKTPYVFSNLGYGIVITDNREGDILFEAGAGWLLRLGKKTSLTPEIAYRHQEYKILFNATDKIEAEVNSISVGIGINF